MARVLRVEFESAEVFEREYGSNLVKGGVFVATDEACEVREQVKVVLSLPFCQEKLALGGEIVHMVTPEMAPVAGGTAGVAVQFDGAIQSVRKVLEPLRKAAGASEAADTDPGRRRSPRVVARVAARIDAGDGDSIAGHTRDVSHTGVLIAVPGKGVPVGDRVEVSLTHPSSGDTMEIEGVVARDVGTGGGVTGLGIDFAPSDQQREELVSFVDGIQHTEHARRLGGIRGDIAELGVPHVLQMFSSTAQAGTLTVRLGELEGLIGFESGLLRYAQMGATSGMKALVRLLGLCDGTFEFHTRLDPVEELEAPLPLEAALFEATRLMDELARLDLSRFPDDAQPRVVTEPNEVTKLDSAILDLARVGFNVLRIVEVIPEPDPDIYASLSSLVDQGILEL